MATKPAGSPAPTARLTTIRVRTDPRSRNDYLTSYAAFLACAIVMGLQRRRRTPVKVVFS